MNIGIIVYSYTGNTLSVAEKLRQALITAGHTASIARVEPVNDNPRISSPVKLKSAPDISPYDVVVFASPVQAFSLAPVMKLYLSQIQSLAGKKVYCFVTQGLKKKWMGGNRALRQIRSACRAKEADMEAGGVVNWSGNSREKQIDDIVKSLSSI